MLESVIFGISFLFNFILVYVFVPLATVNGAVAYVVFVSIIVALIVLMLLLPGALYRLLNRGRDIFSLDTKEKADVGEEQSVEKEKDTGKH